MGLAVVERDPVACETIRENQRLGVKPAVDWPLLQEDVADVDFARFKGVDVIAGGPPCQPFAISGARLAHQDDRNMFPAMMRAVRELSPRAVLVENVTGLVRGRLKNYFRYILMQLELPAVERRRNETWPAHLARLEAASTSPESAALRYDVDSAVLQAADFGVPQRRERVFIVAFRSDLESVWTFPGKTHSFDRLLWDQWVSGDYWDVHKIPMRLRPALNERYRARLDRLKLGGRPPLKPWLTVRDALAGLPEPSVAGDEPAIANHVLVPGARVYEKHTGSPIDMPAKTLKAGAHGVPGGENILVSPGGAIRYFTIRECARLQTFPDEYVFKGGWKGLVRQVGNAVPIGLVEHIARSMRKLLSMADSLARSAASG